MTLMRCFALSLILASMAAAATEPVKPDEQAAIAEAVAPSLVRVEYTLQYDRGDPPSTNFRPWRDWQDWHDVSWRSPEDCIQEERPLEMAGFLVSDTEVVTTDLMFHPRFIKQVHVRAGDEVVEARISGYAREAVALFLELAEPLPGAVPLAFDADLDPPDLEVRYAFANGTWAVGVSPWSAGLVHAGSDARYLTASVGSLIVDRNGRPVGVTMAEQLPADGSWKGSPQKWARVSAKDLQEQLDSLEKAGDASLMRVALSFRSPRKDASSNRMWGRYGGDEEATERNVLGLLIDEKRILVLAGLAPNVTARLERVLVHRPEGKPVPATFDKTLRDYGCFTATLETPLEGAPTFVADDIADFQRTLLLAADIRLQGENRVGYYQHARIRGLSIGWHRQLYPDTNTYSRMGSEDGGGTVLFDAKGRLLAIPVARRAKVTVRERWGGDGALMTPVVYVQRVLEKGAEDDFDPNNVPLSEEEENRLAWIGMEFQPLDKELARANGVSHLTNDGETGALVTYVYEDSPAAEAGVEPGQILLRVHVDGHPKPLEVELDGYGHQFESFPWERLDDLPEQYFDQLPAPWPSAENTFTRALTDLGFGTSFQAEFFQDGKEVRKPFEVVRGPKTYDSAARHKNEELGLSVRDMTYEVRRYFQKTPDDPGVVISKIEPGSKGSVAGLRPYEIITHVNDEAVQSIEDFERLVAPGGELRLSVLRMSRSRIVKVEAESAEERPEKESQPEQ